MSKETIRIRTLNGTNYTIDLDGCFLRYNEHEWNHPHNSWKCTGVAQRGPFNQFCYYSLSVFIALIRAKQINTYKNGTGRFYLWDRDHGTGRLQMDAIETAYLIPDASIS